MTTLQIQGQARYIAFADGFIPSKNSLHNLVLPNLKDDLLGGHISEDEAYVITLERLMGQMCRDNVNGKTDIYLIAPNKNPPFPTEYNPINEEHNFLNDRKDDYRLSFIVSGEEATHNEGKAYFESTYLAALRELQFEIRPDDTYKDLPRFRNFLWDLACPIVVKYLVSLQVEKDFESLGLRTESGTI